MGGSERGKRGSRRGRNPRWKGTLEFFRAARATPDFSLFDLVHGYVYGRWPYLYIGIGVGEHPWAKWVSPILRVLSRLIPHHENNAAETGTVADVYHGKVMPTASARRLVTVNTPLEITDLEQVIPFQRARALILEQPDHIVALECPCRSARAEPCLPLDVCLIVGEPFASFVVGHHPDRSRWISQGEAVATLEAERDRGHVHHAFFKDAMLGRFYAICNCCPCCCGAMQAMRNGSPMLISSGYVSQVDDDLCALCETCVDACPFDALSMAGGRILINQEICMGCGICVSHCPEAALSLVIDPSKPAPLEITSGDGRLSSDPILVNRGSGVAL
jgi:ferredoxin